MAAPQYVLPSTFKPDKFLADIKAAKAAVGDPTEEDARHMKGIVLTAKVLLYGGHALLFLGILQAWGPLTAVCCLAAAIMISTGRCMNWTIIGHHTCHGGLDKLQSSHPDALPPQYKRGIFAFGARRVIDWLDWMKPEAWDVEHNKMHHYYLSEDKDPDLVERNFVFLRSLEIPRIFKYLIVTSWMASWKYSYYSPSTFKVLQLSRKDSWISQNWPKSVDPHNAVTLVSLANAVEALLARNWLEAIFWPLFFLRWVSVILPMLLVVFLPPFLPLVLDSLGVWPSFAPVATEAAFRALKLGFLAEALTNMHSFIVIVCNHSGDDMYWYSTSCQAYSAEWFLRCTYSSVNFETGNEFVDIFYGWLNYQIEHHMFPDMTPLQYRKLQPLIKSVCKKHGVQYVQENGFWRTFKMMQTAVGDTSMSQCTSLIPPQEMKTGKSAASDAECDNSTIADSSPGNSDSETKCG
jgi:fatty acid desaturase